MNQEKLAQSIYEHCLGSGDPTSLLVSKGELHEEWVNKYLYLLSKAVETWGDSDLVPRKIAAAVHYSSFYLNIRYAAWQQATGRSRVSTEFLLGKLRTPSEVFMLSVKNA